MGRSKFRATLARLSQNETAATAVEYGIIAGLVAIVAAAAVAHLGTSLSGKFNIIASQGLSDDTDETGAIHRKNARRQLEQVP